MRPGPYRRRSKPPESNRNMRVYRVRPGERKAPERAAMRLPSPIRPASGSSTPATRSAIWWRCWSRTPRRIRAGTATPPPEVPPSPTCCNLVIGRYALTHGSSAASLTAGSGPHASRFRDH
jgi:hypothetical protein